MAGRKAVFFDIDGTLLKEGEIVPESTVEAIRRIRKKGHLAFVCSGRSRIMIPEHPILSIGFDGVVAACGLYGSYGDKVLFDDEMTVEMMGDIIPVMKKADTMYILEGTEYIYYDEQTIGFAVDDWYIQTIRGMVPDRFCQVPLDLEKVHANKISIQVPKHHVEEVFERARKNFQLLLHDENIAELVPFGVTKADGIRRMCEALGVKREDTFAVGDSVNDVDMLRYAGCGIVMGNGTAIAKENADYITADIEDDGIWKAMEHFGLL